MNRLLLSFMTLLLVAAVCGHVTAQEPPPTKMRYPLSAVAHKDGVVYVADRDLPGVWTIKEGKLALFFQGQKKLRTPLNAIRCLAIDKDGKLLAGDSATRAIYRFEDGKPVKLTKGKFGIGIPMSLAVNGDGEILAADLELKRIWKVPAGGGEAKMIANVPAPRGLAVDKDGVVWVVANAAKADQLWKLNAEGKPEAAISGQPFRFPHNVVVDDEGAAYVSDGYAKAIWKVAKGGEPTKLFEGAPLKNPVGLSRIGNDLLVVDPHAKAVFKLSRDGKLEPLIK